MNKLWNNLELICATDIILNRECIILFGFGPFINCLIRLWDRSVCFFVCIIHIINIRPSSLINCVNLCECLFVHIGATGAWVRGLVSMLCGMIDHNLNMTRANFTLPDVNNQPRIVDLIFAQPQHWKHSYYKMIYHHEKEKCKQRPQQIIELSSNSMTMTLYVKRILPPLIAISSNNRFWYAIYNLSFYAEKVW